MNKKIYSIFGKRPNIDINVYIDPASRMIGDVSIGKNSAVLYGTIIRGDDAPVNIGVEVAILENCIIEAPIGSPVKIGDYSLISHGAIIHGAVIETNVLVGIGAIVLDKSIIGRNSIIAAGSVVPPGKNYDEYSLIMGIPARRVRKVREEELEKMNEERKRVLEKSRHYAEMMSEEDKS